MEDDFGMSRVQLDYLLLILAVQRGQRSFAFFATERAIIH